MHLTDEEKRMLAGDEGEAVQMAMQILTRLGDVYGAERMVDIRSAHTFMGYMNLKSSVDLVEKFANLGARFKVLTTSDPIHRPEHYEAWENFSQPEHLKRNVISWITAMKKLGAILSGSCIPYFEGNLPRFGQRVSWVESSAISFANSVIGARANRTTVGIELASAITGKVPEFGLLLDENRAGNALVKLEFKPESLFDYGTIGYIIGKSFGDKVPVIDGLGQGTTANQLKVMGAAAASRGMVPLYHAIGITPEARTKEEAFKGKRPKDELKIGRREIESAIEEMSTFRGGKIDAVLVGCPHPLLEEIEELARLLNGKRIRRDAKFCLFASSVTINFARQMGYMDVLEDAGVDVLEGECALWTPTKSLGWSNIATNSAKYANILPSDPTYLDVIYTDTKGCVELATN